MAETSRITGNIEYTGNVQYLGQVTMPTGAVGDDEIEAAAGIAASKVDHRFHVMHKQPNTTATTETVGLYLAKAAGTVIGFRAGSIGIAVGAATVTFDLKKNNVTVLTGVLTLNSSNTVRVAVAGTLVATPTYVANDFFELVITATAGGGTLQTGIFAEAWFEEDAA